MSLGEGLLLLHGAGGRALAWQNQLLAFPRARALDLPGRAGSTPTRVEDFVQALRVACGLVGASETGGAAETSSPLILAGHSLGGAIALRWAISHPEEVRALVLVCTGARLRVAPQILEGVRAADPEVIEQFGAMWFGPNPPPRQREKALALLRATPPDVLAADLEAADRFDAMAEIDRLRLPTLVISGALDRLTPVKYGRYLHERIAGSEMVIVEQAGHMVMLEQPRATNHAIRMFLERLERVSTGESALAPGAPGQEVEHARDS